MARVMTARHGNRILAQLGRLAQRHDEVGFVAALQTVDWAERPPDEVAQAAQLALLAGAHMAARQLAQEGAQQHPAHAALQRLARLLAPPRVIGHGPARPDLRANHDWIKRQSDPYRGRWVALRNGQLLTAADTFDALADQFPDPRGILLTKIF
jgi:hypothetical protein